MVCFGAVLIFLSLPLFVGFAIGDKDKRNMSWPILGSIMLIAGIVICFIK
jgi:hypothetical protein